MTAALHHRIAVGKPQQHKAHAQPVQGGGAAFFRAGLLKVGPQPLCGVFHVGKKGLLCGKACHRIGAHGLGPGKIFQPQGNNGGQKRQQGPRFARPYPMQHKYAQQTIFPQQRQQQPALTRQELGFGRRGAGGKIQGVSRKGQK